MDDFLPRCGKMILGLIIICLTFLVGILAGNLFQLSIESMDQSTYSIVALDPTTGNVGAAGASCVPFPVSGLAALVPGKGSGAIQAAFVQQHRDQVFEMLQANKKANEIIARVSSEAYDTLITERQYGVVTIQDDKIQAQGYSGASNNDWYGDLQSESMAVSVQGNTLENEAVVRDALDTFRADNLGDVTLSDRLMRALEAASAAGGDLRCNSNGNLQTAQSAFIAVSRSDQTPFAAEFGRDPAENDPNRPWLYLSVVEPKFGSNPLIELRRQYDEWRITNLPACPDCMLTGIEVPQGVTPAC